MKRHPVCIIAAILLFFCHVPMCHALTYVDSMADTGSNNIRTCVNLLPISSVSGYPPSVLSGIPGQNALTSATPARPEGYVEYRVTGADSVTVGFYTWRGSFVGPLADGSGSLTLGAVQSSAGYLGSSRLEQALYSSGTGGVYMRKNGTLFKIAGSAQRLEFVGTSESPGDLIDYAVNVYAGTASSLSRISLSSSAAAARTSAMRIDLAGGFCYEELTWSIPAGASVVRVQINDMTHLDTLASGGQGVRAPLPTGMRTTLAKVSLSGGDLRLGEAEPAESVDSGISPSESPEPESSAAASSTSSSPSSTASRRSTSSTPGAGGGAATGGTSSSTSKFTGTITASPSSPSAKRGTASSSSGPAQRDAVPSEPELPPEEPAEAESRIFHISPGISGGYDAMIQVYIVVVCGLILLLLLRGRGN